MAYTKTQWVNNQAPALDATNLNKIEQGIYDAHTSKQDTLISGSNIKTVNSESLLGAGDIEIVGGVLQVDVPSFSSLPQTVSNADVTADHVVVNSVLGTPSALAGDWTVTASVGSLTIAGTISGSTTLTLYLAIKQ